MADKTIGSLPQATSLTDDSSFVCEDNGEAKRVTGKQFKDFAKQGVSDEAAAQIQAIQSAGDEQTQRVADEGSAQTANAKLQADAAAQSAAGAAQSAQEAAESAAVYGEVVSDVTQLKQDTADIEKEIFSDEESALTFTYGKMVDLSANVGETISLDRITNTNYYGVIQDCEGILSYRIPVGNGTIAFVDKDLVLLKKVNAADVVDLEVEEGAKYFIWNASVYYSREGYYTKRKNVIVNNVTNIVSDDLLSSFGLEAPNLYDYRTVKLNSDPYGMYDAINHISDFIEVVPGKTYFVNCDIVAYNIVGYDRDRNVINWYRPETIVTQPYGKFTIPENVKFIRIAIDSTRLDYRNLFVVEGGLNLDSPSAIPSATKGLFGTDAIRPHAVKLETQTNIPMANIFDSTQPYVESTYINEYGFEVSTEYHNATYYIPVKPNTTYYVGRFYIATGLGFYYDKQKTAICSIGTNSMDANAVGTITTPENAEYVRLTITKTAVNNYPFISEIYDHYMPYGFDVSDHVPKIEERVVALESVGRKWIGKKVLVLGDSISDNGYHHPSIPEWNKWPVILRDKLGFDLTNDSITASGYLSYASMGDSDTYKSQRLIDRIKLHTSDESYDLILIFFGINDAINGVTIGDSIDESNPEANFRSALEYCLTYLINTFPASRIGYVIPLQMRGEYTNGKLNRNQYVEIIKERCEYYNIPIFDTRAMGGFRPHVPAFKNLFTELGGDGYPDALHPNQLWDNNYLAPQIAEFMDRFVL